MPEETKLSIDLSPPIKLGVQMSSSGPQQIKLQNASGGGTRNYERLINKPQINGVELAGNVSSADLNIVSENTVDGWDEIKLYVPKAGEICIFTDTGRMKVGDGLTPIVDLPYILEGDVTKVETALQEHVKNSNIHVTKEEKDFWNAKLNYEISGENLIFNQN